MAAKVQPLLISPPRSDLWTHRNEPASDVFVEDNFAPDHDVATAEPERLLLQREGGNRMKTTTAVKWQ